MGKNYYFLKEILLGLRKSYLNSQFILDFLKEYVSYNRIKYNGINFSIISEDGIRNIIICNLLSRFKTGEVLSTRLIETDGKYAFESFEKDVQILDYERFSYLIEIIKSDEFLKITRYTSFVEKDLDGNKVYSNIMFDPSGIYVFPYLKSSISYIPNNDVLKVNVDDENFGITLDTKISKDIIPNSYNDIIYNSGIENKKIEMFGIPKANKITEYSVDESDSKVLLIKRY